MNNNVIELLKKLPFNLPETELKQIIIDASFQPQDNNIRTINRNMQFWGHDIIEASYACFLFNYCEELSVGEIAGQLQGATTKITNIIYTRYDLEKYLFISNGEIGNTHPEIANRLMCLIYMHYGFKQIYDFLLPSFKTLRQEPDYKTILQNYAQKNKISPEYKVIEKGGLEHEPYFVVEVRVGSNTEIGEDCSQKKASKEAARNYLLKYNIPLDCQIKARKVQKDILYKISNERMNDINKVIDLLKIKRGWVSDALLDKALTHKSYVNESKNGSNESYEKLREIGAYILKMLCDEFVFSNFDKEQINIKNKCREFMYQSMATNILSNKCLDYVLRGKGIKNITDDKMKNKIISEVQKSLLGAIWITYIKNGNEELKEKAMQFSLNYFEKNISNKKTFDYRTSLNIIRDKFKLDIIIEQCRLEGYPDNDPKYKSIITIKNSIGASIEVSAIGNSKKKSLQNTSQKALQELYDRSNNEEIKNELSKILRH